MTSAAGSASSATLTWREALLAGGAGIGLEALTDIVGAALEDELPLLRSDPDLKLLARQSSAANVDYTVGIVSGTLELDDYEPPPQAIAFARELARRNVPVVELGRAYRLAQHALWRWSVGVLREHITDEAELTVAMEEMTDAALATGDQFSNAAMERYAAERERWLRSADAVRAATVAELLDGTVMDLAAAGRRLGYELRRAHQAFVVWADGEDDVPETVAAAVGGPRALLVPMGVGVIAGWAPAGSLALDAVGAGGTGSARIALGSAGDGLAGFRDGHRQAMEARRVARLLGRSPRRPVVYDEVALLALLTRDVDEARAFAVRTLGPLAADDETTRRLAATLLVVLEEQGSPRRAGQRLGVHENTVAKRLRAIDALGGPPAHGGRRSAELLAALTILQALRGD